MALVPRPIQQLNTKGSEIWTLEWFGGLVENPRDYGSYSVECILTPCSPNPDSSTGLRRHKSRQEFTTLGVSALNAICLGRNYLNGKFVPLALDSCRTEEVIKFRFNPARDGTVKDIMLDQVGLHESSALINKKLTSAGLQSPVKVVDGFLTSTDRSYSQVKFASEARPQKFKVIFHELEIIRFYYTNSHRLVKAVFSDSFMGDNLYRDIVFAKHQGPHSVLDGQFAKREGPNAALEPGSCRFEYRMGFYSDAQIIGRMLFDSTGTAMRGVRSIYQSVSASILNEISIRKTAYPRTLFPYFGEMELTLKGRRVKLADNNFIFVVHRIESCNAPFPFKTLRVQCEIEPGGDNNPPPDSPVAFFHKSQKITGPGEGAGELDSEGQPLKNSVFAGEKAEIRLFLGLNDVDFSTEKVRPSTHLTGESPPNKYDPNLTKSSTGTPTSGHSEAVKQKLVDSLEGSDPPFDMGTFIAILDGLADRNPEWTISTIPLSENSRVDPDTKVTYCGFPSVACPERKSVLRQFSFHDKDKKKRRQLICAQILAADKYVYLLEAERRQNVEGKEMEALPILVLWTSGFLEIEKDIFQAVLKLTVKNPSKTWPQDVSAQGLMRGAIDHRRESKAVKQIGKKLPENELKDLKLKEAVERVEKFLHVVIGQSVQ